MRTTITIHSAELHKEIFLKGKYSAAFPGKGAFEQGLNGGNIPVHDDLRIQFHRLIPHVIRLADLWGSDGKRVPETSIKVLGFALSGKGDKEGVVIIATRELDNAKLVDIQTPFQPWDDPIAPYELAGELSEIIEDCKAEVIAYIVDRKSKPNTQASLFGDDGQPLTNPNPDGKEDDDQDEDAEGAGTGGRRNQSDSI